jgi:hypothetical protein
MSRDGDRMTGRRVSRGKTALTLWLDAHTTLRPIICELGAPRAVTNKRTHHPKGTILSAAGGPHTAHHCPLTDHPKVFAQPPISSSNKCCKAMAASWCGRSGMGIDWSGLGGTASDSRSTLMFSHKSLVAQ